MVGTSQGFVQLVLEVHGLAASEFESAHRSSSMAITLVGAILKKGQLFCDLLAITIIGLSSADSFLSAFIRTSDLIFLELGVRVVIDVFPGRCRLMVFFMLFGC